MLSKLLSCLTHHHFDAKTLMSCIENVIGEATFDKEHFELTINGKARYIPWVYSQTLSRSKSEDIKNFIQVHNFALESTSTDPIGRGQIQCMFAEGVPERIVTVFETHRDSFMRFGDRVATSVRDQDKSPDAPSSMVKRGGGMRDIQLIKVTEQMALVEFLYDVRKANGANVINTVAEELAKEVGKTLNCRVVGRILSNESKERRSTVKLTVSRTEDYDLFETIEKLVRKTRGIDRLGLEYRELISSFLDGVQPIVEATGNDWRGTDISIIVDALEHGLFDIEELGSTNEVTLVASIPMSLGIVGAATRFPGSKAEIVALGYNTAEEVAECAVAVGLLSVLSQLPTSIISSCSFRSENIQLSSGRTSRTGSQSSERQSKESLTSEEAPYTMPDVELPVESSSIQKEEKLRVRDLHNLSARQRRVESYLNMDEGELDSLMPQFYDPLFHHQLPIGFSPRFVVNGQQVNFIPFIVEEPSVVAANAYGSNHVDDAKVVVEDHGDDYHITIHLEVIDEKLKTTSTSGKEYRQGILDMQLFSEEVKGRTCTETKGAFNGIDPILMALNIHKSPLSVSVNQQRFVGGRLRPLIHIANNKDDNGLDVHLDIRVPKMPFEEAGGTDLSDKLLHMMGNPSPQLLAATVMLSGMFSTFAARKALGSKGINWGHKRLHNQFVS